MNRYQKKPSTFQLIFSTVVGFTILGGIGSVVLATQPNPSPQQSRIFETANDTWKLGVGAIFGLMGATNPEKKDEEPRK